MTTLVHVSVATLRLAELAWVAGRASLLGAHEIPGAVWWRITEDVMPKGVVLLEVWGVDRSEAWRYMCARDEHVSVVLVTHPARWRHRVLRWLASRWWRWVLQRRRLRGRS